MNNTISLSFRKATTGILCGMCLMSVNTTVAQSHNSRTTATKPVPTVSHESNRHHGNREMDREVVFINLRHSGDLDRKLTPSDRRFVRELIIEGVLNEADYKVLKDLSKRKTMINSSEKEVTAKIDIDLKNTRYFDGERVVDILPRDAFYYCDYLHSIVLPSRLQEVGKGAFKYCKNLESVTLPDGLLYIGDDAFRETSLTEITIPASVTTIGSYAFEGTKIEKAVIGANIKECSPYAFDNNSLKSFSVAKGNTLYSSRDGVLYSADGLQVLNYPKGRGGSYVIPDGVTGFTRGAFSYHKNLISVTLPESITTLPNGAFEECNSLSTVNIPSKITMIPEEAFRGCKALVDFVIPENILYIGEDAFRACKGMRSIVLPSNLKSIDEQAFYYCEKLITVTIPATVKTIGSKAFYHCDTMTELIFTSPTPPAMEKINDKPKKLTIVVPQGSKSAYSSLEALKKHKVRQL